MGPVLSFRDFVDMLRRRAWLILLVIAVGCGLSVVAAKEAKHKYRSTEVIQVTQPKIEGEATRDPNNTEDTISRRLQLIEQRVMARESVLAVIEKYGLYADLPALTENEKVDLLRTSVRIDGLQNNGSSDGWVSVLTVTAEMPTARQAQEIAHEFASRTIELSNESRLDKARETLAFFTAREETLREHISRVEDELAAYRKDNAVALPGTLEIRRSEITSINNELLDISRQRIQIERAADLSRQNDMPATAARKQSDFSEQLTTLEAQAELLRQRKGELEASLQSSPEVDRRVGAYDHELEQIRAQLQEASARRTDAEVAYRLETQAQSERLTVIEPASLPDYPFTRSRKKLALVGAAVSVMMALGLAFVLELRKPVMRTPAHMERDLGIRPVVSIPYLDTRSRRRRRRGNDKAA
ncbi:MAG: GumC family protein [Pseudodonghicola sp.]|uniref:GumC family protein n=1 Tax=Pseudodonghicola sp. TaxID=1969463 RepID=UPI003A9845B9